MTLQPAELTAAIAMLDEPLYGRPAKAYALRHLLARLSKIWYYEVEHVTTMRPQDDHDADLVHFKDWTIEHIYPKTPSDADIALNQAAHEWFHGGVSPKLHCLGNLAPLHPSLNTEAGNHAFVFKRTVYDRSNNALMRAAGDLRGYERLPTDKAAAAAARAEFAREVIFSQARFQQRHSYLKDLIMAHIFDVPVDSAAWGAGAGAGAGSGGVGAARRGRNEGADEADPGPKRQRARIAAAAVAAPPGPGVGAGAGLPALPSYHFGGNKSKPAAYLWALENWGGVNQTRLRAAISSLFKLAAGPSFHCAGSLEHLRRFHLLAGSPPGEAGFTQHILSTRRLEIIRRVAEGAITIADVEVAADLRHEL